jgi:hypothetical protein
MYLIIIADTQLSSFFACGCPLTVLMLPLYLYQEKPNAEPEQQKIKENSHAVYDIDADMFFVGTYGRLE